MVELRGVSERFGDFTAVNEVSLEIRRGEFLTLLRTVAGFETAAEGSFFPMAGM